MKNNKYDTILDRYTYRRPIFRDDGSFWDFNYYRVGDLFFADEGKREYIVGPWEQCIGFRDKNGGHIFEGDVLIDERGEFSIKWNDDYARFIRFRELSGDFNNISNVAADFEYYKNCEIIGNIHTAKK